MLPLHNHSSSRKSFRPFTGGSYPRRRSFLNGLLTRARITNLGLLLLASFAIVSFLINLSHYFFSRPSSVFSFGPAKSIVSTINRIDSLEELDHLIIVPGHAIWSGYEHEHLFDEDYWTLESYQRGGGRVQAFISHIKRGAEIAQSDDRSLLVFSGGQTRASSLTTEGDSYLRLASFLSILPRSASSPIPYARATSENHALDSYQNLLFSVARFFEYTGRFPRKITVVGYEFKRRRFTELHRHAMRWPAASFVYEGIDGEMMGNSSEAETAKKGEIVNGFMPYTKDMYGCHDVLLAKRRARNLFSRFHPYHSSVPAMRDLFEWCPGQSDGGWTTIFPGPLPWDGNDHDDKQAKNIV